MNNSTQANAELMRFDGKPSWGAAFPQAMQHVLAMLIGNITPPYASNLFISARMAKAPVSEIIPPVMPYLLFVGIPVLLLTTFVPVISTWLPSLFKG